MALEWNPEQLKKSLDSGSCVFLKLWKKGCGACKLSEPAVERIAAAYAGSLEVVQICTDDHPEILELSGSEALPAFFVFKDKELKGKILGFKGLAKLEELVKNALA